MRWMLRPVALLAFFLLTVLAWALVLMRLADRAESQFEEDPVEPVVLHPRPQAWWPGVETRPG